jgi:hypothetical protein
MREGRRMANEEHVKRLKQGVEGWNKWRDDNEMAQAVRPEWRRDDPVRPDLSGAILINADLGGANLSDANLSGANLSDVLSLTQTQLDRACGKPRALPQGLKLDKECPAIARPPSISGKSTACGFRSSVAHPTFTPP